MKRVYNLIALCILLICQQDIVAQSYNLGNQKQSFAYETLYSSHVQKTSVVKNNNETTHTPQPASKMASAEDIQKCKQVHKQIVKLSQHYTGSRAFNKYNGIYKSLPETQENILNLQKIQYVVISHLNSQGTAFPQIEKELKNASSMEAEIAVFLSYCKE